MRETPKGGLTYEQVRARVGEAMDGVRASIQADLQSAHERIAASILAGLAILLILVISFLTWVWFIAECVQLATRWGWLP
jgi:hypothetical protein